MKSYYKDCVSIIFVIVPSILYIGYFRMLGADMILDMTVADDFSLLESQREFVERYRAAERGENTSEPLPMLASSCPGMRELYCSSVSLHGSMLKHGFSLADCM
jgi:iron only hydrogenase large subunit-like protein